MGTEEQREALQKLQKETLRLNKKRKKKLNWLWTLVIIFLILSFLIKLTIGTISLKENPKKIYYRYYDVRLNDRQFKTHSFRKENKTIIPFLIYKNKDLDIVSNPKHKVNPDLEEEKYILTIESYSCYIKTNPPKKVKEPCNEEYLEFLDLYKNKNDKYQMKIFKYLYYNPEEEYKTYPKKWVTVEEEKYLINSPIIEESDYDLVYDSIFKEDITEYIKEKGVYVIQLFTKYQKVKEKIQIGLVHKENGISIFTKTK